MPGIFQGGLSRKGGLKDGAWRMGTFVNVEPELRRANWKGSGTCITSKEFTN